MILKQPVVDKMTSGVDAYKSLLIYIVVDTNHNNPLYNIEG